MKIPPFPILLRLVALLGAFAVTVRADALNSTDVDALVPGYLQLQQSLAGDDLAGAKEAAATLLSVVPEELEFDAFTSPLQTIAASDDIKPARAAFADATAVLMNAIENVGTGGDQPLYVAFCPMAFSGEGGTWLQADRDVLNPYYGAMMPRCGVIKRQLAGE